MKNYSIHVNKNEVFSWITAGKKTVQTMRDGKTGPLDPRLLHQMERAADQIEKSASARYIYNVFELIREEEGPISLKGSSLRLPGKDIASLLKECSRCILLTVTIGGTVDRILRRAQISDMRTPSSSISAPAAPRKISAAESTVIWKKNTKKKGSISPTGSVRATAIFRSAFKVKSAAYFRRTSASVLR